MKGGRHSPPESAWLRMQVDSVTRHFFASHRAGGGAGGVDPLVDVVEGEEFLVVEMELPGVSGEGLRVYIEAGHLVVEGNKEGVKPPARARFLLLERQFGAFQKSVEIPLPVNAARVSATLAAGVLTVRLPRVKDKRSARVPIKVSLAGEPDGPVGGERP